MQTPASAERQQHCCRLSDRSLKGRGRFQHKVCVSARKQLQKNLSKLELHTTFPITAGKITGISHLRLQSHSQYHHSPHLQTCIPAGWHHCASIHAAKQTSGTCPHEPLHSDWLYIWGFPKEKSKAIFAAKTQCNEHTSLPFS